MKLLITPLRKGPAPLPSPLPPPSPPPSPCPWLWRCHSCYTIYRLAVTRRCLDCDHTFCLGEPATAAGQPRGKKRKRGGPCKAEFDYTGWKARGAWRRTVLLNGQGAASTSNNTGIIVEKSWGNEHGAATGSLGEEASFEDKRERLFLRRRHNCFLHCDFPSECHHSLFRAQQEGRPILREAEALDAAEAASAEQETEGGKRFTRRLTVQEYKQRRAERRRRSASGSVVERFDGDLSTVTEEEDDADDDNDLEDTVSPCSPTSPDPPGDLMREVSPVEADDNDQPLSPSGRSRPSRASLLVTTDTPVDFATTAAPLSFDETYSDDEEYEDDDGSEAHEDKRRTKSRRKVTKLTGEGLQSFGPFILDPTTPSPTSPLSAEAATNSRAGRAGRSNINNPTALDLQAAWSEQAWFSSSSSSTSTTTHEQQPLSPKSPERVGRRDRMFALLGRRGSASPTQPHHDDIFNMPARQQQQQQQHEASHHGDATAVAGEEWESWSDSSSSSTYSSSSSSSTSSGVGRDEQQQYDVTMSALPQTVTDDTDTDADGDVPMRDAIGPSSTKDVDDEDMDDTPMTPPTVEQRARRGAVGGNEAEDLRALLRMRNAFMRGEMI